MDVPRQAPGTSHPYYVGGDERAVRWWLDETDAPHMVLPRAGIAWPCGCEHAIEVTTSPYTPLHVRVFSRYQGMSPAPWAGRAFRYTHWIGVDDLGRAVAGEKIERRYEDPVVMFLEISRALRADA